MHKTKLVFLSSTIAMALSATAASAADWAGPYVGLNLGSVVNADTRVDQTTGQLPNNTNALTQNLRPSEVDIEADGFTAGAQVGYNWQFGDFAGGAVVAGVEADMAYTDIDETLIFRNTTNIGPLGTPSNVPVTRVNEYRSGMNYLATVRARLGLAFDNVYIYGTGGLAYGDVDREIIFYGPNADTTPFFQGSESGGKSGYVYGAGVEYALPTDSALNVMNSSGVTLKAEYLHYDLGDDTLNYPGVNGGATIGGYSSRVATEGDIARVGINFKF